MTPRAAELVRTLSLTPHPEGGFYREIHRSAVDRPALRAALTEIYFLLAADEHSRWHRIDADEVWHHLEGGPLELLWFRDGDSDVTRLQLAPVAEDGARPVAVVPAGAWQAARPLGAYTLAACTVAPGFEFSSFRLLSDDPAAGAALRQAHPLLTELI